MTTVQESEEPGATVRTGPALPRASRGCRPGKRFADAERYFEELLKIEPWWPAGHYNRALILGEIGNYDEAAFEMKKYLALEPEAPDARAARDQIYVWESK